MNVFLIGYRGSGKSTVARLTAELLEWKWLDADEELERRAEKTIKQIFADDGESSFRELETTVIADIAKLDEHVIALGGGSVVRQQNRTAIAARGPIVWLKASAETLWQRIQADQTTAERRPNLTEQGGLEEIRSLLAERTPIYAQCADLALDAESPTPQQIAQRVAAYVQERKNA